MESLYTDILNNDNMTKNEKRLWHMKNFHHGTFPLINGMSSMIHNMYNDLSELDGELKEMTVQGGKYGPNLSISERDLLPMQHQLALGNYQRSDAPLGLIIAKQEEHNRTARDKLFFGKALQSYEGTYKVGNTIYGKDATTETVKALREYKLRRIAEIEKAKSMP